jgi:hypothetical protein
VGLSSGRKSALERRLKDLQKEADLVRSDIKALNRVVKNPDGGGRLPKLRSERAREPVAPPVREDPVSRARTQGREPAPPAGSHDDLFDVPPRVEPVRGWGRPAPAATLEEPASGARSKPVAKDERFANYFSSGGFLGGSRPLKQEKNVQRNKAVFMIGVVIVVFFWVSYLVFR